MKKKTYLTAKIISFQTFSLLFLQLIATTFPSGDKPP